MRRCDEPRERSAGDASRIEKSIFFIDNHALRASKLSPRDISLRPVKPISFPVIRAPSDEENALIGQNWPREMVSRHSLSPRSPFSRGVHSCVPPDGTRAENRNRRRTQRPRGRHATPGRLSLERRVSRASDHVSARSRGARRGFLKPRSLSGARVEEAAERLSEDDTPGDRPERGDVRARGG